MKILYGIQGTGNGHLARARTLVPELRKAGIEIDFVFSGRAREDFFNMDVFYQSCCIEPPRYYPGLTIKSNRGKMSTLKTVVENNLYRFFFDAKALNLDPYDLVLSDFEPVTAWAAKLSRKTSIGISHQCAFDFDVPKVSGYFGAKILMRTFAPTTHKIGLHWHHFQQPVLPPLIEPLHEKPTIENKILVYMGFEAIDDIVEFVQPFEDYNFYIYAKVETPIELGHVKIQPLSHEHFHNDLIDCAGVISNCGFELASECLSLGKKLLTKPLLGQYEQLSNAFALEQLQRGTVMKSLDKGILQSWLDEPSHVPMNFPNVAAHLAEWILSGDWNDIQWLVESLWHDINQQEEMLESWIQRIGV